MGFWEVTLSLLRGLEQTCLIFALTLVLALPLGLVISFGSMSRFKPLAYITKIFVWIIRGVPLMLQVIIVFYVPGILLGGPIFSRLGSVVAAFVINYACYFSEIYRGGIESISKGQYEAGQVLGMTKTQIFFKVVLMQVVKRIIPPMSNEIITLVKDTALARVIMVVEIIKAAENYAAYGLMWPLFYTAVFYLVFVGALSLLFGYFEKKLDYYKV
ncbi:MAG: amino acid ABC transporter permease [Clostridia bacterium]|nr:amino acid ABC transporter permease [Clostridia bacterium]